MTQQTYPETLSWKIRFSKSFQGVELTRSLPTTSILVVTIEIYRTCKNLKIKAFSDVFKDREWVHSILH